MYYTFGEGTYVGDMSISTDNEDFYNFIKSIKANRRKKSYGVPINIKLIENQEDKLKLIISFFTANAIKHIFFRGRRLEEGNRFCIHNLFISGTCNCERCTFERLDIKKTEYLLKQDKSNYS